jgi:hypothetical protein
MWEVTVRYEVRVDGASIGVFAAAEAALERVRQALAENPDHEPEIIDMTTGKAYQPAATTAERDQLSEIAGF